MDRDMLVEETLGLAQAMSDEINAREVSDQLVRVWALQTMLAEAAARIVLDHYEPEHAAGAVEAWVGQMLADLPQQARVMIEQLLAGAPASGLH